jgi:hypothetical protein
MDGGAALPPPPCYEASSPARAVQLSYATVPEVQPQEPGSLTVHREPPISQVPLPQELQYYGQPQQQPRPQQYHVEQPLQQPWQPLEMPFSIMPDGQHPTGYSHLQGPHEQLTQSEGLPEPNRQPEGTSARCEYESESATSCKNIPFATLFAAHVLLFVVLAFMFGGNASSITASGATEGLSQTFVIGILVCMCLLGAALGSLWLLLLFWFTESLIKLTFVCASVLMVVLAIIVALVFLVIANSGDGGGGGELLLVALFGFPFMGYQWYRSIAQRIPLATGIIKLAAVALAEHKEMVFVAYAAVVAKIVWALFWLFVVTGIANSSAASKINGFVAFFFILCLCWSMEVIRNIVFVTASGVAGSWLFYNDTRPATTNALKRACTTSFGTIGFGSLMVGVLEAVYSLWRSVVSIFSCCLCACVGTCFEGTLRGHNSYAYVYAALYGTEFTDGAAAAWGMMTTRGFHTIVIEDLSATVQTFCTLVSATVCAVTGGMWAHRVNPLSQWPLWSCISFLLGGYMCTRFSLCVFLHSQRSIFDVVGTEDAYFRFRFRHHTCLIVLPCACMHFCDAYCRLDADHRSARVGSDHLDGPRRRPGRAPPLASTRVRHH